MPPRSDSYSDDALVALGDGAALIGVSRTTLRKYANDGRIPVAWTPTGYRRFKVADLRALITEVNPVAAEKAS